MTAQYDARRQSALGINITAANIDTDAMRNEVLSIIRFSMMHDRNDEPSGLVNYEQMTGRRAQANRGVVAQSPVLSQLAVASPSVGPLNMPDDLDTALEETGLDATEAQMNCDTVVEQPPTTLVGNGSIPAAVQIRSHPSQTVESSLESEHQKDPISRVNDPYSSQAMFKSTEHEQVYPSWVEDLVSDLDNKPLARLSNSSQSPAQADRAVLVDSTSFSHPTVASSSRFSSTKPTEAANHLRLFDVEPQMSDSEQMIREQSPTTMLENSSTSAAFHDQSRSSRAVELSLEHKQRVIPKTVYETQLLSTLSSLSWADQLINDPDEEDFARTPLCCQSPALRTTTRLVSPHASPSAPQLDARRRFEQDSSITALDLALETFVQANPELVQRSRRPLPTIPSPITSVERDLRDEIQQPASPRRRLQSKRFDAPRVVVEPFVRRPLPVSPSVPIRSRRSNRSSTTNHFSPIRTMRCEIRTPIAQNLSLPLHLRGGENACKGGNTGLRRIIFRPSPLRNEVVFSPPTVRLARFSSKSRNQAASSRLKQRVDTLAVTRGFAHLLSTPSTRPKPSRRLVYRDGFLVEMSTDESFDQPSIQQKSTSLVSVECTPEPMAAAVSGGDTVPKYVASPGESLSQHTTVPSHPHTERASSCHQPETRSFQQPKQTTCSHQTEKTVYARQPENFAVYCEPDAERTASSYESEYTTSSCGPKHAMSHSHEIQRNIFSSQRKGITASRQPEYTASIHAPEHTTSSHQPYPEFIVPHQSPPRPRFASQRNHISLLHR